MKKRMFTYILNLAVLLCVLFFSAPSASAVSTDTMQQWLQEYPMEECSCTYTDENKANHDASVYFSPALLFQDSSILSPDMAKASMALSATAYNPSSVNSLLRKLDFQLYSNTESYDKNRNGLTLEDCDYAAYTIGYREVTHPETQEPCIIYCVPIQGTYAGLEWISDFNVGDGQDHEGFRKASEEIYNDLLARIADDGYDAEHRIIWLAGHSRGGACANLIAGWFTKNGTGVVRQENLFAYTFASPAVSKNADATLTNIFNFVNPGDLVPMLPMPEWGYGRYGQTFELDSDTLSYANFATRFAEINGKAYRGSLTGEEYRPVLSALANTEMA